MNRQAKAKLIKNFTIVILLPVLVLTSCSETTCKTKIEQGVFISADKAYAGYRIARKKDVQIEYFNNDSSRVRSRIYWVSDSEYYTVVTHRVNYPKAWENLPDRFNFKVISCNDSLHKVETVFQGKKVIHELKRIK